MTWGGVRPDLSADPAQSRAPPSPAKAAEQTLRAYALRQGATGRQPPRNEPGDVDPAVLLHPRTPKKRFPRKWVWLAAERIG